jgi:hypothetical protein
LNYLFYYAATLARPLVATILYAFVGEPEALLGRDGMSFDLFNEFFIYRQRIGKYCHGSILLPYTQ